MNFILKAIKFVCAIPCFLVAFFAALFLMLSARGLDILYPEKKTSVTIMRAILGFNTSHVELAECELPPKAMGLRIYK